MCYWKIKDENIIEKADYLTECNFLANRHEDETEYYEFCPYCGEPIDIEKEPENEE